MLLASFLFAVGMTGISVAASTAQVGVGAGVGVTTGGAVNTGVPGVPASAAVGGQGAVGTQVQGSTEILTKKGTVRSEQRTSVQGQTNQNAQGRAGATKGLERAKQRMSPKGLDHAKSLDGESSAAGSGRVRATYK
jgi:hypothetical protein